MTGSEPVATHDMPGRVAHALDLDTPVPASRPAAAQQVNALLASHCSWPASE